MATPEIEFERYVDRQLLESAEGRVAELQAEVERLTARVFELETELRMIELGG